MTRKALIALAAVAALGVSSSAMAAKGGGGGGGGGGGMGAVHGGGGMGAVGRSGPSTFSAGPSGKISTMSGPNRPGAFGPGTTGNWKGGTWSGRPLHHHHRFGRNAFFLGVGFAGPYSDSCWRLVPTYWGGWRRVWVCDYPYPYWGY